MLNPFHEVNWRPGLPELRKFALSLVVALKIVEIIQGRIVCATI